jgi:LPXTG-motif cell wall-anchored protein
MSRNRNAQARPLRIAGVAVLGVAALAEVAGAQDVGIFVSSTVSKGNLGGLAGADAICQSLGAAAFPGSGPWVAWLSDSTPTHARDRIAQPGAGGAYVRATRPNHVIATSLADLTDGSLAHAVVLDETGHPRGGAYFVWTGSTSSGRYFAGHGDCNSWTSDSGSFEGGVGSTRSTGKWWVESQSFRCCWPCNPQQADVALYCVGPLAAAAPTVAAPLLVALGVLLLAVGGYLLRRRRATG